jgi:hypothetical protein
MEELDTRIQRLSDLDRIPLIHEPVCGCDGCLLVAVREYVGTPVDDWIDDAQLVLHLAFRELLTCTARFATIS